MKHLAPFIGAFAKLPKATTCFVMSVLPSARLSAWNNSAPSGRIFMKSDIWVFSKNCRESWSIIRIGQEWQLLYMATNVYFWLYLARFFLGWEMFQTKDVEEMKTRILCLVTFFLENRAFLRQCAKIFYKLADHRWQYGAWALLIGYLRLQTHTHICNTYCFSTVKTVARKRLNVIFMRTLPVLFVSHNILLFAVLFETSLIVFRCI
jgi:hypothetical protein